MNRRAVTVIIILLVATIGGIGIIAASSGSKKDNNSGIDSAKSASDSSSTDTASNENNPTGTTINIVDSKFDNADLTITAGTTVTWTNQDELAQTITPDKESDDFVGGRTVGPGESYSVTFNTPGEYTYYSEITPDMTGKITVTE